MPESLDNAARQAVAILEGPKPPEAQRLDTMRLDIRDARWREVASELNGKPQRLVAPGNFKDFLDEKRIDKVSLHYLLTDRRINLSADKKEITIGGLTLPAQEIAKALGAGTEITALNRWRREELHDDKEITTYNVPFFDETTNKMTVTRLSLEDYGRLRDVLFGARPDQQKHPVRIESSAGSIARSKTREKEIQSLQSEHRLTSGPFADTGPFAYRLKIEHASSIGKDREIDEDYIGDVAFQIQGDPTGQELIFVNLNDGMGGHDAGDEVSVRAWQAVKESLIGRQAEQSKTERRLFYDPKEKIFKLYNSETGEYDSLGADLAGEAGKNLVRGLIREANKAVYDLARQKKSDAGTTFVGALIVGNKAIIGNVGDSRAYFQEAKTQLLSQLTVDHSLVERLIATGQITVEEARFHPQRNVIYRVLGDKPAVEVDVFEQELNPGDSLVLTCDGNPGAFGEGYSSPGESPKEMSAAAAKSAKNLVSDAIQREECGDNCSAVKVTFEEFLKRYQTPEEAVKVLTGVIQETTRESLVKEDSVTIPVLKFGIKQLMEMRQEGKIPGDQLPKYAATLEKFNTLLQALTVEGNK